MDEGSDRLSNLPDSVLVEILSPLNAKEVFQTRVLSKRWLNVWASVPRLDFNSNDFDSARDPNIFMKFVSRFLDLRGDSVNTDEFILKYDESWVGLQNPADISKRWILYALNHNPKNILVDVLSLDENFHLPQRFFICESLEKAYLNIRIYWDIPMNMIVPDRVCLPNLRELHLQNQSIDKEYMEKILCGCPVLKLLSLAYCYLMMDEILFRNLEWLTIENCGFDIISDQRICLISAPKLEYLALNFCDKRIETGLKLKDMSKVNKAMILTPDFCSNSYFLSSLSGVADLSIYFYNLGEVLNIEIPHCPTFYNLKILTLWDNCVLCNFFQILSFLAHCPNLEELILFHCACRQHQKAERDEVLENLLAQTERFCCEHLKLVNIESCGYDAESARQVEKVILHCTKGIEGVEVILPKF